MARSLADARAIRCSSSRLIQRAKWTGTFWSSLSKVGQRVWGPLASRMRWPRGRYNGRRIVGVEVKVRINLRWWSLDWPSPRLGMCGSLGPVHVWLNWEYDVLENRAA